MGVGCICMHNHVDLCMYICVMTYRDDVMHSIVHGLHTEKLFHWDSCMYLDVYYEQWNALHAYRDSGFVHCYSSSNFTLHSRSFMMRLLYRLCIYTYNMKRRVE